MKEKKKDLITKSNDFAQIKEGKVSILFSKNRDKKLKTEPPCVLRLLSERSVLRKRDRMPKYCQIVLMPMFAAMTKILDHLFLTGIGGMTKENFSNNQINLVINATLEVPSLKLMGIETIRVPVDDSPEDDIQEYFDQVTDIIDKKISNSNANIVVHCVAGVSRSTSLVIAYLIKYKSMSLHDAFNFVHSKRPIVRPNNGFFKQLIDFEKKIRKKTSVSMVVLEKDGLLIEVPDFFINEHKGFIVLETLKEKAKKEKKTCKNQDTTNERQLNETDRKQKQLLLEKYVINKSDKKD